MEALKRFDVRFLGLNEGFGVCFVGWIEDFFDISCFFFGGYVIAKVAGLW